MQDINRASNENTPSQRPSLRRLTKRSQLAINSTPTKEKRLESPITLPPSCTTLRRNRPVQYAENTIFTNAVATKIGDNLSTAIGAVAHLLDDQADTAHPNTPTKQPKSSTLAESNEQNVLELPSQYVRVAIDSVKAERMFNVWLNSLWCTPFNFSAQLNLQTFSLVYVPVHTFNVSVLTRVHGRVGVREANHNALRWHSAESFLHTRLKDVPFIGVRDEQWLSLLRRADMLADAGDRLPRPHSTQANLLPTDKLSMFSALRCMYDEVRMAESGEQSVQRFCDEQHAAQARQVETKTHFSDVSHRVVYVPIFLASFEFADSTFVWTLHANSGKMRGSRPYGFGSLLSTLVRLATFNVAPPLSCTFAGVLGGSQLCCMEGYHGDIKYAHDEQYLVVPPSDSFLGVHCTAFCVLQNASADDDYVLTPLRRRHSGTSNECTCLTHGASAALQAPQRAPALFTGVDKYSSHAHTFTLRRSQRVRIAYRGFWVFLIRRGNRNASATHAAIRVVHCDTNGGDSSTDDLLHMC